MSDVTVIPLKQVRIPPKIQEGGQQFDRQIVLCRELKVNILCPVQSCIEA